MTMKVITIECPLCHFKMAVQHVDDVKELIGCKVGCSGCGKRLAVEPPDGKLVEEDDRRHAKFTRPLPKG
jgi:hypothetical protein